MADSGATDGGGLAVQVWEEGGIALDDRAAISRENYDD